MRKDWAAEPGGQGVEWPIREEPRGNARGEGEEFARGFEYEFLGFPVAFAGEPENRRGQRGDDPVQLVQQARQGRVGRELVQQAVHLGQCQAARLVALGRHVGRLVPLADRKDQNRKDIEESERRYEL